MHTIESMERSNSQRKWNEAVRLLPKCKYTPPSPPPPPTPESSGGEDKRKRPKLEQGGGGGGAQVSSSSSLQQQRPPLSQRHRKALQIATSFHSFFSQLGDVGRISTAIKGGQAYSVQQPFHVLRNMLIREIMVAEDETIASLIEYFRNIANDVRNGKYDDEIRKLVELENGVAYHMMDRPSVEEVKRVADEVYREHCQNPQQQQKQEQEQQESRRRSVNTNILHTLFLQRKPNYIPLSFIKRKPWGAATGTEARFQNDVYSYVRFTFLFPLRELVAEKMIYNITMLRLPPNKAELIVHAWLHSPPNSHLVRPNLFYNNLNKQQYFHRVIEYRDEDGKHGEQQQTKQPPSRQRIQVLSKKEDGCFNADHSINTTFVFGPSPTSINTIINFTTWLFSQRHLFQYFYTDDKLPLFEILYQKLYNVDTANQNPRRQQQIINIRKQGGAPDSYIGPYNEKCFFAMTSFTQYAVCTFLDGSPMPYIPLVANENL